MEQGTDEPTVDYRDVQDVMDRARQLELQAKLRESESATAGLDPEIDNLYIKAIEQKISFLNQI